MVVTTSNSISMLAMLQPYVPAQSSSTEFGQPFAHQLAAAIAPDSPAAAAPQFLLPAMPSSFQSAALAPAISSVTILPFGPSIATPPVIPQSTKAAAITTIQTAAVAAPAATAGGPLPPSQLAINALSTILKGYGIDPASLGLTYSEQAVAGPTGAYSNNMITATFPSGKSQDFSAALTLKNPFVAAVEIMGMLGRKVMA